MSQVPKARTEPGSRLDISFRIFQASVLGSNLADGIYLVSIPLLALSLSGSALAVSVVGVALRAPWLVLTLPAGVVVDRFPPLAVMRVAARVRLPLVMALCLLAWHHLLPVWGLATGAFMIGACGTCADIAAQSLTPRLVDEPLIPKANANLQSGQTLAAQFAGPALGGLLAPVTGAGIGVAAILYAVSVLGLGILWRRLPSTASGAAQLPLHEEGRPGGPGAASSGRMSLGSLVRDLREGARYFRQRRDLIGLAAVAAAGNVAFAAVTTMLPLWVVAPGRLGLSESAMGFVTSAPALGGLVAGAVAARVLRRMGGRAVLCCCAPSVGFCFAAIAVPTISAAVAAMACTGALTVLMNVMSMSHRQATIPAGLFGRVNAVYRWVILGVSPFGALFGGLVAERWGTAAVFAAAGVVCLVTGVMLPAYFFRAEPHAFVPLPAAQPPPGRLSTGETPARCLPALDKE